MGLLTVITAAYISVLFILFIYGNNCLLLAYLHSKRRKGETPGVSYSYPMVTVQLPVYNEFYVAERLIRKVAEMDYPGERLEIQVLDDSTDETTGIIQRCIGDLRSRGFNISLLHRQRREGYKAGALREGMKSAQGEFLAVFDADFLPDPGFLKRCIPYFSDSQVGMVQTRWGHINGDYSLLTRVLSIGIDGHFQVEQNTRCSSGLFLNFNGTGGIWRRQCIEGSGGWQDDTLTEDLDLSYRAQLRGWRLVFLDNVVSPAEVPVQINAFKRQQFRWAKGSIQCAKKLLPEVISADIPAFKKLEAVIHLTYYAVHPLMVALLLLSLPLILLTSPVVFQYFQFFALGTLGPPVMYALSQRELYDRWISRLKYLPILTVIGTGISANNTRAVVEALLNRGGAFQRTPKFGIEKRTDSWNEKKYRLHFPIMTVVEVVLGIYALVALYLSITTKNYFLIPFLALYALGYFYISGLTIVHSFPRLRLQTACIIGILTAAAALRLYRAMMGDLSEDPFHHWFISAYFASTGSYADPISGAVGLWPPGFHVLASSLMLVLGRDILWLKLVNILFSLGGIYLVYKIAGRYSRKAGLAAAASLALNPLELLTSSTSYTETLAVFFFLMTVYFLDKGREKTAGITLIISAATRYEVWLAVPFLLYRRMRKMYLILPSIVFIIAWSVYTATDHGIFPDSIIERSKDVLNYEIGSGAVAGGVMGRTMNLLGYFFVSSPLVYAAGIYFASSNIKKGGLFAFALFYLAVVFLGTASGIAVGSFRYFSLVIPFLCIFGGVWVSEKKKLCAVVLVSLILVLPFYFILFSGQDALYQPMIRAGEFIKDTGARGVISNSPVPLYYSGLAAGHLSGDVVLKGMDKEQGIRFLREKGVEYIVYVASPPGELGRVFPGIENGSNIAGLMLVYDPNGWEQKYGAKKIYVYRLQEDGWFKSTNSYISSSPLIADIDGDGYGEIIAASDMLYIWKKDGNPLSGFPAKTDGLIASTPNIAWTEDGAVIFVGSDDDRLYGWWYNGSLLAGFPKKTDGDVFSKPLLVDMDGDGETEVVAGSDDGRVYAWHMNGSAVAGWPARTRGYVSSSPVAADLDDNGKPEIIAGSWDKSLYAWHTNGSMLPGFPLKTGDAIWATPRIVDIDGDGSQDIIVASDMIYAWNNRGESLYGFPIGARSYIVASPLAEDLDLDGKAEIIVASDSLYMYNSSGTLKDGFPVYTGYYFWAPPVASDLDGDGQIEIIAGDWSGKIYAFKPDGRTVTGFPKHTRGKIFASVAVEDIDRDGTMEVSAGSWDRDIYLWSIENGSYMREYMEPPENKAGPPALNGISISKENGVVFLTANFSGYIERPKLNYYADDGIWHQSPMVLSEGLYAGMIAPQKQRVLRYYISLENDNRSYRFPEVNYYETEN